MEAAYQESLVNYTGTVRTQEATARMLAKAAPAIRRQRDEELRERLEKALEPEFSDMASALGRARVALDAGEADQASKELSRAAVQCGLVRGGFGSIFEEADDE